MSGSKIEKQGYAEVTDYCMSEKFGLDWKDYPYKRMSTFLKIYNLEQKRDKKEANNQKSHGSRR